MQSLYFTGIYNVSYQEDVLPKFAKITKLYNLYPNVSLLSTFICKLVPIVERNG
jgi:hypothetical protein